MRVLITGGTGPLGTALIERLRSEDVTMRVLSRGSTSRGTDGLEWARGNFVSGEGLLEALRGVDVVVHAAHDPTSRARDVNGTRNLLGAAQAVGVRQFVYVSIVGAARVGGIPYYRGKAEGEALVERSALRHSIFRATQFHSFVASSIEAIDRWPWLLVPQGLKFQPVDVTEAGAALGRHVLRRERDDEHFAGPEVLPARELIRAWHDVRGTRKLVAEVPLPLASVRAIRDGRLTDETAERGSLTWRAWLQRRRPVTPGVTRHGAASS